MITAEQTAIPSCPPRPWSSRPSRLPPPASRSCQTADARNAPKAKGITASQEEPPSLTDRPTTTAARGPTVAGLLAGGPGGGSRAHRSPTHDCCEGHHSGWIDGREPEEVEVSAYGSQLPRLGKCADVAAIAVGSHQQRVSWDDYECALRH